MNKNKEYNAVGEAQNDEAPARVKKYNFISYIICVLAAIIIWLVIMNVNPHETIPSDQPGGGETVATEEGSVLS